MWRLRRGSLDHVCACAQEEISNPPVPALSFARGDREQIGADPSHTAVDLAFKGHIKARSIDQRSFEDYAAFLGPQRLRPGLPSQ